MFGVVVSVKSGLWALAVTLLVLFSSGAAQAQSWVTDAQLSIASGLEGGDSGYGIAWQRARMRLVVGLDLGNDENGADAYGLRTFVEIERGMSVGVELGYLRWVLPELNLFFGGVAVVVPETLLGGTAGATYIIPLGKRLGVAIGASLSVLPIGSDLPDGGVLMWGLLGVGIRGRL
jgi:hypothetical protein